MFRGENAKYVPGSPVRYTKKSILLFGFGGAMVTAFIVGSLVSPEMAENSGWNDLWIRVGISALCLIFVGTFIEHLNFTIIFEKHGMIYRNWVRVKSNIPYSNITRYGLESYWGSAFMVVYVERKKYRFYSGLVGAAYLREQLRENVGRDKERNLV